MLNRILLWGQRRIEKGAWMFAPIGLIWGLVSVIRNQLYDLRWLSVTKVQCPVVSVGNLVAGGTGKTPLVILLASKFKDKKVAILTRGYKTKDEPKLIANRLENARVYVGKNRVKLAQQACHEGAKIIILDDGFQHRQLYRDFDLVLLHGSDPFGKGHYLPWGFLRDHPRRLSQADAIFINSSKQKTPYIHLDIQVESISNGEQTIDSIQGKKVAIFCGIAKPHLFKRTVENLGAIVVDEWILADHEKPQKLHEFAIHAKRMGADSLICTEKDFVKITGHFALPIHFIKISLVVTSNAQQWENLIAKITQKIDNLVL
ncbi:MAG TPA: tetraacyldisaccharide 4'-kinase [Chlamydiales bacterium]|nr:tetraacyldisaccharide 4'-kinase [Chlamydiales bacterium]